MMAPQWAILRVIPRAIPPVAPRCRASLDMLAQSDLRPLLHEVHQPVLLVHGAADPLMPLAAAERLLMKLPEARLEVFGGSAHAPFASHPERFVASVLPLCRHGSARRRGG